MLTCGLFRSNFAFPITLWISNCCAGTTWQHSRRLCFSANAPPASALHSDSANRSLEAVLSRVWHRFRTSPHWESDPGPLLYQRSALPLSYVGGDSGGEKRIRTSEAF